MSIVRRARVVLGALFAVVIALSWTWAAHAQTTTTLTTTTTRAATSTTRAATSTSRPSSTTTTTTRKPTTRLTFTASPTIGSPGTNITVASVNACKGTGNFYVLVSIGPERLGSGPADHNGNWRFTVTVPNITTGTYGLAATCLISRNGVDENAGIYVGPDFTITPGSGGPPPPTTPDANKSSNTALIIGLIVAVVVAIAAIAWALWLRRKHKVAAGTGASSGPGAAPPGSPPPGSVV